MPTDPDDPQSSAVSRAVDDVKARAERLAAEQALAAAKARAASAADGALDAVERLLFGKVGGAEDVLRREATADPLERLRQQYGRDAAPPTGEAPVASAAPPPPPKEDPEAVARRQLEELKRQYAAKKAAAAEAADAIAEGRPPKRTL